MNRDVSLCAGNGQPACEDCARRLADVKGLRWWIEPVADGEGCEMKIEAEPGQPVWRVV